MPGHFSPPLMCRHTPSSCRHSPSRSRITVCTFFVLKLYVSRHRRNFAPPSSSYSPCQSLGSSSRADECSSKSSKYIRRRMSMPSQTFSMPLYLLSSRSIARCFCCCCSVIMCKMLEGRGKMLPLEQRWLCLIFGQFLFEIPHTHSEQSQQLQLFVGGQLVVVHQLCRHVQTA